MAEEPVNSNPEDDKSVNSSDNSCCGCIIVFIFLCVLVSGCQEFMRHREKISSNEQEKTELQELQKRTKHLEEQLLVEKDEFKKERDTFLKDKEKFLSETKELESLFKSSKKGVIDSRLVKLLNEVEEEKKGLIAQNYALNVEKENLELERKKLQEEKKEIELARAKLGKETRTALNKLEREKEAIENAVYKAKELDSISTYQEIVSASKTFDEKKLNAHLAGRRVYWNGWVYTYYGGTIRDRKCEIDMLNREPKVGHVVFLIQEKDIEHGWIFKAGSIKEGKHVSFSGDIESISIGITGGVTVYLTKVSSIR